MVSISCRKGDSADIPVTVYTTLDRTIIPDPVFTNGIVLKPTDVSKFAENSYGFWHFGPGLP